MNWIDKWTIEINKIKDDILAWSNNINRPNSHGGFFSKNKTRFYTLILFSGMALLFWGVGFISLARVCGIILILQVGSFIWSLIKTS